MNHSSKEFSLPKRSENYAEWYQKIIVVSDLAEHSSVRGCMVIKPWGYALWEKIVGELDRRLKETGHQNAYFPLFIPLSYLEREATHIEGFAKECAVVTHHRLIPGEGGGLVPDGPLEEPLIVRPTSEMIIGESFSKWISSYRDLPLLINQWANVVRWEMRPRLFLRTTEFLWQEGHTAHAHREEAVEETLTILELYRDFMENFLAIPVIQGEKSESERFPGAENTYTLEAMMQDGKALQTCTSHFLGQNFSKAAGITFCDHRGETQFAWTTSWGTTTRLIGTLIMVHSDDVGLVLPPKIAAIHVVIIPFTFREDEREPILSYCHALCQKLKGVTYEGSPLLVHLDLGKGNPSEKGWSWVKKGVPIRIEVGLREVQNQQLTVKKRHQHPKERELQGEESLIHTLPQQLEEIQNALFHRAHSFLQQRTVSLETVSEFYQFFKGKGGGFVSIYWANDQTIEEQLRKELNISIRCVLPKGEEGICPFTQKPTTHRVIFAKSY